MRAMTSAGPTAHPTRTPVAANALLMPSTKHGVAAPSRARSAGRRHVRGAAEAQHPVDLVVHHVERPLARARVAARVLLQHQVRRCPRSASAVKAVPVGLSGEFEARAAALPAAAARSASRRGRKRSAGAQRSARHAAHQVDVVVVVPARHRVDDAVAGVDQRAVGRVDRRPRAARRSRSTPPGSRGRARARRSAGPPRAARRGRSRAGSSSRRARARPRMPSLEQRSGIGNCRGLKSPTVRSQTGLPAATMARISAAMRRISEPLRLATIREMRAAPPAGGVATSALRSCAARTASDMTAQYDTGQGRPPHQCRRPSASSRLIRTSWAESRTRCEVGWLVTRTANAIFGFGSGPAPT